MNTCSGKVHFKVHWVSHTWVFWIRALLTVMDRLSVMYSLQKESMVFFYQPTGCSLRGELLQPQPLFKMPLKHQLWSFDPERDWINCRETRPNDNTAVRKGSILKNPTPWILCSLKCFCVCVLHVVADSGLYIGHPELCLESRVGKTYVPWI